MGTKEKLLELLESRKGEYLSGEELASVLKVSRTAVWKAAVSLRDSGYGIDAVRNRGYRLDPHTDSLSNTGVYRYLDPRWKLSLEVLPCTVSTNALLRERANAGAPEGTVILANQQTQGRGRLGRDFYSPPDTGIYMSLLLRPNDLPPADAIRITTMAAVAACKAIREVSGKEPGIKWVNDILLSGKKVSGILTEASFQLETGSLEYVVLGVGFNVYTPAGGFPPELESIAGAIFQLQQDEAKNRLAASFLNHFLEIYSSPDGSGYACEYRQKSILIGQPITVTTPSAQRKGYALDVDNQCRLIVRYDDGTVDALSSADISIRQAENTH